MTIAQAKKLQAALKKVHGTCTLLIKPYKLKEYPSIFSEYPSSEPYVLAGRLRHDSFYEPSKDADGWHGFFSITLEHQEIPAQWVSSYIEGPAFTLIDPEGYPCAIFATYEEANKKYTELWPPRAVHQMRPYPKILDPKGHPWTAVWRGPGINYPWTA